MINYLSIDLESWASPNIPEFINLTSEEKKKLDNGHIKASALRALDILEKHQVKLTFFVVGQLYDWYPEVVEEIASSGHEIAYHTHDHDVLIDKNILLKNLNKSKKFLQRFKPIGFRAPRISIEKEYLSILSRFGFKYDSSTYGDFKKRSKIGGIQELPVSLLSIIPIGSGYFTGMLGKNIAWFYQTLNKRKMPVISFLHNWQILKPVKPTFPNKKYVLTHPYYFPYLVNCSSTLEYLLERFTFSPMKNLVR